MRHLREHVKLAQALQVPEAIAPNNGDMIRLAPGPLALIDEVPAGRLYLDNVDHVQASWFSEGQRTGQVALHAGADDWGGTLFEENVHKAADYVNTISVDEIVTLIRDAGFAPAQRTTTYEIGKRW